MTLAALGQIRTIARGGDIVRAWRMFCAAGLLDRDDPDVLSLKGRLLKDRALRAEPTARASLLDQARQAYLQAAVGRRATYPLINAATLAFLNGRADEAERLARDVLALLESGDHEAETRYWLGATAAEALLLLGDMAASRKALEQAVLIAPEAWEDHAATLRQLQQILALRGLSVGYSDHLRPPPSLYFCGVIGLPEQEDGARAQIEEALDRIRPGSVFGALAAGADILVAERAVARGAQLHVVLPTALDVFRDRSVSRYGAHWAQRFDRLVEMADSLEAPDMIGCLSEAAIAKGAEIAMGLAIRKADALSAHAVALHVGRKAGVEFAPKSLWRQRGLPLHNVVLDQCAPPSTEPLACAVNRIMLASLVPLSTGGEGQMPLAQTTKDGLFFAEFDSLASAMAVAEESLKIRPDMGLALEYRTCSGQDVVDIQGGLAPILARVAPAGSIWAPWPQAAALDVHGREWRFEFAGEIQTPYGDCPIAQRFPLFPL